MATDGENMDRRLSRIALIQGRLLVVVVLALVHLSAVTTQNRKLKINVLCLPK